MAVAVAVGGRASSAPIRGTFNASGIDTDLRKTLAIFLLKLKFASGRNDSKSPL